MNCKRIILIGLALCQMMYLFSQKVVFTYDSNGNRSSRTIVVEPIDTNNAMFPITEPKNLRSLGNSRAKSLEVGESIQTADAKGNNNIIRERIKTEEDGIAALVYPNPNKGLIKIDISNMPTTSINEMRFYDLNGNELKALRNFDSHSEIDISQYKDGIYILRIKINSKRFDFKIIKGQTSGN